MDPVFAFFAALGGYLIGSVSFARLMIRAQGMEGRNDLIRREVEGSDADFVSDSVGGTTVAEQLGRRLGCLTALLDIAKPIVVILATLAFLPDEHYHLIAGVFTVVGHNYPVFHRFDGGRGMSTLVGGFLVVDPLGFFATQVTAMALGIAVRRVLVLRWSGIVFMIPWLFVVQGVPEGLFAVAGRGHPPRSAGHRRTPPDGGLLGEGGAVQHSEVAEAASVTGSRLADRTNLADVRSVGAPEEGAPPWRFRSPNRRQTSFWRSALTPTGVSYGKALRSR
jgi:glycerol-3-phosphate acyltransferase PlsY